MEKISVYAFDIEKNNYKEALLDGFSKIQFNKIVKSDDTILIKPNLTWPIYKKGVTTTSKLLDHLSALLKNKCTKVIVAESDGCNSAWTAEQCFIGHKFLNIAKKNGFKLVNLTKKPAILKRVKVCDEIIRLKVSKYILDKIDVMITVPVLKTHIATEVSLGLKNQWGCLPNPNRMLYHPFLHKSIVAVNKIYKPKISVIDATYGLSGNGPINGTPIKLNKIIISNNVPALDIITCSFMGIPFEKVEHLKIAKKELISNFDLNSASIFGDLEPIFKFEMYKSFYDKITSKIMFNKQLNDMFYSSIFSGLFQKFLNFYKMLFKKESAYY